MNFLPRYISLKRTPIRKKRSTPRPGRLKGDNLTELRESCFARDHHRCRQCGIRVHDDLPDWHGMKAHMAHIQAKRMGGDNLANVRTLCGTCHRTEHAYGPSGVKPCPKKETV